VFAAQHRLTSLFRASVCVPRIGRAAACKAFALSNDNKAPSRLGNEGRRSFKSDLYKEAHDSVFT